MTRRIGNGTGGFTHNVVVLSITLGHFLALAPQILLERRIHNQLFADRVTSELPDELVSVPLLVVVIALVVDHLIVVLLQLAVVLLDGLGNARHLDGLSKGSTGERGRTIFTALAQLERSSAHTKHSLAEELGKGMRMNEGLDARE